MKKGKYLICIGIFVMLYGVVGYTYAGDNGILANYISILEKKPNSHGCGSDVKQGESENPGDQGDPGTVEEPPNNDDPAIENASVDIRPNTINLKRHGIFTAIIKLPESIDAGLIDAESIILFVDPNVAQISNKDDTDEDDTTIVNLAPPAIAEFTPMTTVAPIRVVVDTENTNSVIAKFSNQDIVNLIETDIPDIMNQVPAIVTFWVRWQLTSDTDNETSQASDDVRVINPGKGKTGMSKGKGKDKGKDGGAEKGMNKMN